MLRWNKNQDSVTRTSRRLSPSAAPGDVTPLSDLCRERKGAMLPPCCCAVAVLQLAPDEQREWHRGDGAACLLQRPRDRGGSKQLQGAAALARTRAPRRCRCRRSCSEGELKSRVKTTVASWSLELEVLQLTSQAHACRAQRPGLPGPPIIIVGDTVGPARGGPRPARRTARP